MGPLSEVEICTCGAETVSLTTAGPEKLSMLYEYKGMRKIIKKSEYEHWFSVDTSSNNPNCGTLEYSLETPAGQPLTDDSDMSIEAPI